MKTEKDIEAFRKDIEQRLIDVGNIPEMESNTSEIPVWIKNNAGWWADGSIDDTSFVQGIQFLVQEGFMKITN